MTPLCRVQRSQISLFKKQCVELFSKIFEKKLVVTNFVDYLREFEAIFEKAITCVSGAQGKLFYVKKKTEVENVLSGSL
jgi:hypothetical protein